MNWDDLRFVLALADAGSLARAAKVLGVDHTTVGRRIEAAEAALGVSLFTRTSTGYVATADADRLLVPMKQVEDAVHAVERRAQADRDRLDGTVRVTSPETFGAAYLAPRLAVFGRRHPDLVVELLPGGEVLDLGRRQAELAVRPFRSTHASLVVRKAAEIRYGLYASTTYLEQHPLDRADALHEHTILGVPEANAIETMWLERLDPRARPSFVSSFSLALLAATRAGAGVAVLPRYLGDGDATLRRIAMPEEPTEPVWLTVHRDLRDTPRVRALLDFLGEALREDSALLNGG